MNFKIPFLSPLFQYFKIFYTYTGYKLFVLILIILTAGIFEGLGISILIPFLSFESSEAVSNRYTLLIYDFLNRVGLGVSLSSILMLMILLFFLKGLFTVMLIIISSGIKTGLDKNLKVRICRKYSQVKYSYFINKSIGYFNDILSTEAGATISGLNSYINVIVTITHILIYISSALLIDMHLSLTVLLIALFLFFIMRRIPLFLQKNSIDITKTNAEIQSLIIQKLYNFKYLKATGGFERILENVHEKLEKNRSNQFKNEVLNGIPNSIIEIITVIFLSLMIWYYVGVEHKHFSEIIVLLIFFYRSLGRILNLQSAWQRFSTYIGAIHILDKEINDLDKHRETDGASIITTISKGIELRNVDFLYHTRKILTQINMTIPKNKCIGIVGHSGAGKTTLFDMLTGLIPVESGSVHIDDTNYNDVDFGDLRKRIGYVTQEPVIFNDTIANNITFWDTVGTDETRYDRILNAAKLADCTDFILECENGFDTVIGEKGVKLSGGQCQRIAIAREIYKNPQLMIFDEATSSLDTESERSIQKSIFNLKGSRTIILIAHRLSTIMDCDHIYVLSRGRIEEDGTFYQLFSRNGSVFREMCLAQGISLETLDIRMNKNGIL